MSEGDAGAEGSLHWGLVIAILIYKLEKIIYSLYATNECIRKKEGGFVFSPTINEHPKQSHDFPLNNARTSHSHHFHFLASRQELFLILFHQHPPLIIILRQQHNRRDVVVSCVLLPMDTSMCFIHIRSCIIIRAASQRICR